MEIDLKKIIVLVFILLTLGFLFAEDYLDINFFIEPRFERDQINMVNFLVKNIRNDSIRQVNAFAGRILTEPQSDSLAAIFINTSNRKLFPQRIIFSMIKALITICLFLTLKVIPFQL